MQLAFIIYNFLWSHHNSLRTSKCEVNDNVVLEVLKIDGVPEPSSDMIFYSNWQKKKKNGLFKLLSKYETLNDGSILIIKEKKSSGSLLTVNDVNKN